MPSIGAVDFYTFLATIVALFVFGELFARYLGLANYILYRRCSEMGYIPEPNSSGLMRRRYRWRFNGMGMRSDFDGIIDADGIVLVGDSIVEGGASVDQADTLGSHVSRAINRRVYSVGAGGWSLPTKVLLGVRPATVRSQIASARRKTGHASVRELVLALAVLPPLGP